MRNSDPTALFMAEQRRIEQMLEPFMAERHRIEQMFEPFKAEQRCVEYQALTDFGVPTRWSAAVPPPVVPAETPRVRLQPYVTPDVFLPPQRSSAQEIRSLRAEVEELRTLRAEDRVESGTLRTTGRRAARSEAGPT